MTNDVSPCTKPEAKALTDRIRQSVDQLWSLLLEADRRKAWKALGYDSIEAYVNTEIGISRPRYYQIINQGKVIEAIHEAAGVSTVVDISEREARDVKRDLPAITTEIKARVEAGEEPDEAVAEVIAQSRRVKAEQKAERDAQQAEWDRNREETRKALSPAVQAKEAAKARNGSVHAAVAGAPGEDIEAITAERDELREENAALRNDVEDLRQRLAKFDDMAVQWEKGGFEAVRATDLERIRVLQRQVEDMSADRASAVKSRDYWKKQALALGYVSPNEQVEAPEIDQMAIDEAF